jgi:hypothetical protein
MITQSDLDQFTGTECYHKYIFGTLLTDGVHFLCTQAKCFWLADLIGSWQPEIKNRYGLQRFQVWTLTRKETWWIARCEDGNGKYLCSQEIPYSDFPLEKAEVWLVDNVMLLPSEY